MNYHFKRLFVIYLHSVAPQGVVCWGRYTDKKAAKVVRWACMPVRAWEVLLEVVGVVLRRGGQMKKKQEEEEVEGLNEIYSFLTRLEKEAENRKLQMNV